MNRENEGYLSAREINKYFCTMCLLLRVEFLSMSRSKAAQSAGAPAGEEGVLRWCELLWDALSHPTESRITLYLTVREMGHLPWASVPIPLGGRQAAPAFSGPFIIIMSIFIFSYNVFTTFTRALSYAATSQLK